MNIFDINNTVTSVYGYPLSYVELIGTLLGLLSVWFAAKENIWTWTTGMINIICFFGIFYQVQLYSDMFLQIYFFITSIYGWMTWKNQQEKHKPIATLTIKKRAIVVFIILISTILFGCIIKNIHLLFPKLFIQPASYPFADTFIAVSSIIATVLLAKRIVENWILWLTVDFICVYVYAKKNILLVSIEYGVFFLLALFGLLLWKKSIRNDQRPGVG